MIYYFKKYIIPVDARKALNREYRFLSLLNDGHYYIQVVTKIEKYRTLIFTLGNMYK